MTGGNTGGCAEFGGIGCTKTKRPPDSNFVASGGATRRRRRPAKGGVAGACATSSTGVGCKKSKRPPDSNFQQQPGARRRRRPGDSGVSPRTWTSHHLYAGAAPEYPGTPTADEPDGDWDWPWEDGYPKMTEPWDDSEVPPASLFPKSSLLAEGYPPLKLGMKVGPPRPCCGMWNLWWLMVTGIAQCVIAVFVLVEIGVHFYLLRSKHRPSGSCFLGAKCFGAQRRMPRSLQQI